MSITADEAVAAERERIINALRVKAVTFVRPDTGATWSGWPMIILDDAVAIVRGEA